MSDSVTVKVQENSQPTVLKILGGRRGAKAPNPEFRSFEGWIQWRLEGDETWQNLVSHAELSGS